MKLLIRNMDRSTTEEELRVLFEAYGTVQYCDLVLDKTTGGSKGFAFVEMPKIGQALFLVEIDRGVQSAEKAYCEYC